MCRNGRYTEHGIKEIDGFCSDHWCVEPSHAVKVAPGLGHLGVLMEPASVLAKAWEHVERIGRCAVAAAARAGHGRGADRPAGRASWAGQRGLEVHVLDRVETGPKPQLVKDLVRPLPYRAR